jgi:hypothetical protein
MYTGKTSKPCCLCGRDETDARVDLPPVAVPLLRHGDPIAWRDIDGKVSIHFCADDWETVRDLVLEVGTSPLSRCNAAHADFDLRQEFEALLTERRERPDQEAIAREMLDRSRETLADGGTDRELVEARLVQWALEDAPTV